MCGEGGALEAQVFGGVDPDADAHAGEGGGELAGVVLAADVPLVALHEGGRRRVQLQRRQLRDPRHRRAQRRGGRLVVVGLPAPAPAGERRRVNGGGGGDMRFCYGG